MAQGVWRYFGAVMEGEAYGQAIWSDELAMGASLSRDPVANSLQQAQRLSSLERRELCCRNIHGQKASEGAT